MIKEIKITNFYSFSHQTIVLKPDVNILIGINGSGKSNLIKAVNLLYEGIAGKGLKAHILQDLGGFDNIFFKGANTQASQIIELAYTLPGGKLAGLNVWHGADTDIVYTIRLIKVPGLQNYYIEEYINVNNGSNDSIRNTAEHAYLKFSNGAGFLYDSKENRQINYPDLNGQELVLKEISSTDADRYPVLTAIRTAIKSIAIYNGFDTSRHSQLRRAVAATSAKQLSSDGGNLAQILNTIKINDKQGYAKIIGMLEEVNGKFSGFDFNFISGNSSIELMLEEKELNTSVHVANISDGTLKYLCLLAILYNADRGMFICIDEPETGLHPDMIVNIANAIKTAGENSAIIISTHSENLLNYFGLENLHVFEKDEYNSSRVSAYNEQQFEGWYKEFAVGHMWKAGDFGGVRYGG